MANDEDDPPTKDNSEDAVHRLRDILVEEVSLVDRAANKRKFLIVKRSNDVAKNKQPADPAKKAKAKAKRKPGGAKAKPWERAAGADDESTGKARRRSVEQGEDGDEAEKADDEENDDETEKTTDKSDDDDSDDTEKADDEEDDDSDDTEKADDEEDDDDSDEAEKADDEDDDDDEAEKATKAGDDDATEDEDDKRFRPKQRAAKANEDEDDVVLPPAIKTAVLRALTQVVDRLMAVADRVKEADSPDDDTEVNVPEDLTDELDALGELLEGIGERLPTSKSIAKGGARMAKERLDRFEQALKLLSQVLKELTNGKQPPEPSAGSAERTAKRTDPTDIATLATNVGDLLQIVKQQQVDLDRVRKTHGMSNAIPVEGGARARRKPADVSWPLDMNRPISRDSVAKATSFYDDAD